MIQIDRADPRIVRISLNRPPLNVMNAQMMGELGKALYQTEREATARLIVLQGEGKAFSAGADIQEHLPEKAPGMIRALHQLVESIMSTRTPILAVLHGACLGGAFEVASLCDVVLVQEGCRLGLPEIQLASFPPVAAAFYPAMIGWKHTLQLLLTGEGLTPARACELGLATAVLPKEGFDAAVAGWIERLTRLSLPALKLCKMAALAGYIQRPLEALSTTEALFVQELMKLRDATEGLQAFLQKREPVWEHR
jgi:cyclohexa-1,5-dienecarbonyl-CoA hydratase